ncbi:MAG: L-ribulose-5-phosphate 4-epimerase AraD [Burkholderiales bacterium]|nr:L-ribulose-5-phosphate 4-epimerase AraD [Phycisphaerae bacterium]
MPIRASPISSRICETTKSITTWPRGLDVCRAELCGTGYQPVSWVRKTRAGSLCQRDRSCETLAYEKLKEEVCQSNLDLVKSGLVKLTWGNTSAVDRGAGVMAIKPSGVAYDTLNASQIVVLSIKTGEVLEGTGRPSSDTPTHLYLYQQFEALGAVVHTHSTYGTCFAQANREIPCLGTTHCDNFYGPIPVTRHLTAEEINGEYELNAGKVIVETFRSRKIDPAQVPGVLIASHAPFAWGPTSAKAIENAIVLEFTAQMAIHTIALNPAIMQVPQVLLDKHFLRKHGPKAYYGQPDKK